MFFVGVEYVVRQIANDYSYKKNYLDIHSKNIEILILGSSHSFYGINPVYFSRSAFNAAHVSQTLNYDYFIFDKYKKTFNELNTLLIPISYFTLFSRLEDDLEDWRIKNYSIYYGCNYHHSLKYNLEFIAQRPIPLIKQALSYFKGANNITVSELGYGLKYSNIKQSDLIATGKAAAKRHTTNNLDLLAENLKILNKFIDESISAGIQVILFTPPAADSYISNLNEQQLALMKSSIAEIMQGKYDIEYYDFMNDPRFINDDFRDADHLNGTGAEKLTKLLDDIISRS